MVHCIKSDFELSCIVLSAFRNLVHLEQANTYNEYREYMIGYRGICFLTVIHFDIESFQGFFSDVKLDEKLNLCITSNINQMVINANIYIFYFS